VTKPLEEYDHARFGPVLGVSDEGSAAATIAAAAYASAKATAHGAADPMVVGMILDGERMGSAGEVPIGPDEYDQLLPAAEGRTFVTTNVGVRVNTRFYQPLPQFRVADAAADPAAWVDSVIERFAPFVHTPDGTPRRLTVRLLVTAGEPHDGLADLVRSIDAARSEGRMGPPDLHRLSLLVAYPEEIGADDLDGLKALVDLAADLGIPEVAVDAPLREAARRRLSVQGLLNVLAPDTVRELLAYGHDRGVQSVYEFDVDTETAARTVWTGLNSARHYGLSAAKYGLVPLRLEQMEEVIDGVQRWLHDWTPIPAFYVDTPLVTSDDVYEMDRVVEAAKVWMTMAAAAGAKVVLIDAPDRVNPRKLLRKTDAPDDPGVLTLDDVAELLDHAVGCGLRALWSGGNSAEQAFQLGRLGVFGIFTTGSTARVVPVSGTLESDQQLAQTSEPTEVGVRRVHALLQAGYLCHVLGADAVVAEIEAAATALVAAANDTVECATALDAMNAVLERGWNLHWTSTPT
jgi:hypothetical protein